MTDKELLYIKTIVEEKSLNKAAQKLFLSQPALSHTVQQIEAVLGVPLFDRTPHGLSLIHIFRPLEQKALFRLLP